MPELPDLVKVLAPALAGRTVVRAALDAGLEMIVHHMLTGRIQVAPASARPLPHPCFSLDLDDGSSLRYGDEVRMGKVYLGREADREAIPGWRAQGIDEVERAGRPLEDTVRDHVRVRNRRGEPCPVCGTTIRRVGVRGYDSFFCPRCQPAEGTVGGKRAIPW